MKSDIEGSCLPLINGFTKLKFYRNRYFRKFITGIRVKKLSQWGNYSNSCRHVMILRKLVCRAGHPIPEGSCSRTALLWSREMSQLPTVLNIDHLSNIYKSLLSFCWKRHPLTHWFRVWPRFFSVLCFYFFNKTIIRGQKYQSPCNTAIHAHHPKIYLNSSNYVCLLA